MTRPLHITVTTEGSPVLGLPEGTKAVAFARFGAATCYSVIWEPLTLPADHPTGIMSTDFDNGYLEVE